MSRYTSNQNDDRDELMSDLEDDFRDNRPPNRAEVNRLRTRLETLEEMVRSLVRPTGKNAVAQGEAILAKAAQSFHSAEELLAYAETVVSNPTDIGIIGGHLAVGDFKSAQTALLEVQQRSVIAKAAEGIGEVLGAADDNLATFDSHREVSELRAKFGSVERALTSIEDRLGQLESRPQAAAPVPIPSTVAKAASSKKARPVTLAQEKDELLHKIDAFVTSPTRVGYLTSALESGQFDQVRQAVAEAERAHNAERIKQERKSWS